MSYWVIGCLIVIVFCSIIFYFDERTEKKKITKQYQNLAERHNLLKSNYRKSYKIIQHFIYTNVTETYDQPFIDWFAKMFSDNNPNYFDTEEEERELEKILSYIILQRKNIILKNKEKNLDYITTKEDQVNESNNS